MNWCIVHDDNRLGTWERIALRQNLISHKIIKQFGIERALDNLTSNETIGHIGRKNWPAFRALYGAVDVGSGADWCPSIFAICRLLIWSRFIKKYQLVASSFTDLAYPVVSELWTSFCCTTLKLEMSAKKDPFLREKYHFLRPFLFPEQTANTGLGDKHMECIPDKINHLIVLHIGFLS